MKEMTAEFLCNIKEDTFHAIQDQFVFWSMRGIYTMADLDLALTGCEAFLFHHGWAILLLWRILNAALDTHKRLRDIKKPEWKTNVKPLLIQESRKMKGLTLWQKISLILKSLFK